MAEKPRIVFPKGSNIDDVFKTIEKLMNYPGQTPVIDQLIELVQQIANGANKGDTALLDLIKDLGEKTFDQLEHQAKAINSLNDRVKNLEIMIKELLKVKIGNGPTIN